MNFKLNTAAYEQNIFEIFISDEKADIPFVKITLKDKKSALTYEGTLITCLRINEVSINEGGNYKPLNFKVIAAEGDAIIITGNIVQALELLKIRKLLSSFSHDNMIVNNYDEIELKIFLEKNCGFTIKTAETVVDICKPFDNEVSPSSNTLFSETSTSRSLSDASSRPSSTFSSGDSSQGSTPPSKSSDSQKSF